MCLDARSPVIGFVLVMYFLNFSFVFVLDPVWRCRKWLTRCRCIVWRLSLSLLSLLCLHLSWLCAFLSSIPRVFPSLFLKYVYWRQYIHFHLHPFSLPLSESVAEILSTVYFPTSHHYSYLQLSPILSTYLSASSYFAYTFSLFHDLFVYFNVFKFQSSMNLLFGFTKPSRAYDVIELTMAHLHAIYTHGPSADSAVFGVRKLRCRHPAPVVRERWRFAIRIASPAAKRETQFEPRE